MKTPRKKAKKAAKGSAAATLDSRLRAIERVLHRTVKELDDDMEDMANFVQSTDMALLALAASIRSLQNAVVTLDRRTNVDAALSEVDAVRAKRSEGGRHGTH